MRYYKTNEENKHVINRNIILRDKNISTVIMSLFKLTYWILDYWKVELILLDFLLENIRYKKNAK